MSNLSSMFANVNPGLVAVAAIDKTAELAKTAYKYKQKSAYYDAITAHRAHYRQLPTPETTGAPVPMKDRRFIPTPENTGAPMPGELSKKTSIHPITGERVPPTPVKRRGKKPTPPGTKPKKK